MTHICTQPRTTAGQIIRLLGEAIAGDEILLRFTSNFLLVNTKPCVGLWFYQLVDCLSMGLPYQLCMMMVTAKKALDETSPVDAVLRGLLSTAFACPL